MRYRTEKFIKIEAGQFYKTTDKLETDFGFLETGTVIKITEASTNYIAFDEYSLIEEATDYAIYSDSITNNSPAKVVPFEHFIESIEELGIPTLLELNIPIHTLEQDHLLQYIAFLEDLITDKDRELEKANKPGKEKVREVIEWLLDLRDGTDDALGKNCMKAVKLLKYIIQEE